MAENLICSKLSLLLYQTASGYISFKQRKGCLGFPGDADGKKSAYNMGDPDLIPGSEGSPGAGRSNPLQYCCLENSMDRGASQATIHWIAKSCCCFCEVASIVSDSLRLLGRQPTRLPRSLGFSRQEHWSGLPFPSPWTTAFQAPTSMGFPGKSTGVGGHCLLLEYLERRQMDTEELTCLWSLVKYLSWHLDFSLVKRDK